MIRQCTPSTPLNHWVEWLTPWRVLLPSRGIWTGWTNVLTRTSWSSTHRSAKSCTRRNNPRYQYMLEDANLERCFEENYLGVLLDARLNMIQQHALEIKKASGNAGCIRHNTSYRSRKLILPSCSSWQGHTWSAVSNCGFSRTKHGESPEKVCRGDQGIGHVVHVRKSWER